MAEETFYRDQILSNAAVLFPDTFRIVLRSKRVDGKHSYEAVLVDGLSHRTLMAGGPGLHTIQEALFNLLIATSNQMTDHLQGLADREAEGHAHGGTHGKHGLHGTQASQGGQGVQGTNQGLHGAQGTQGLQGSQGLQGTSGNQGLQGTQATSSSQGVSGIQNGAAGQPLR
jgi:hypothetical protein